MYQPRPTFIRMRNIHLKTGGRKQGSQHWQCWTRGEEKEETPSCLPAASRLEKKRKIPSTHQHPSTPCMMEIGKKELMSQTEERDAQLAPSSTAREKKREKTLKVRAIFKKQAQTSLDSPHGFPYFRIGIHLREELKETSEKGKVKKSTPIIP